MSNATYTLERSQPDALRESSAAMSLALSCLAIVAGGLCLGLQVDGRGALCGTGYTTLGIGGVVALIATLIQMPSARRVPRDGLSALSATAGFVGLAFLVAGVLAPGGAWMFAQVLFLVWALARRHRREKTSGPEFLRSNLFILSVFFVFRLWISYQGSQFRWQVMTINIPVLSWIPLSFLEAIQSVSLGSFTPGEMGFPPTGLHFALSAGLWTAGFALIAAGLVWRSQAEFEHENDRIHSTIHSLPPALSQLVERLLPEGEWLQLGLHGLPMRRRRKELLELVRLRVTERADFNLALTRAPLPELPAWEGSDAFASEVHQALGRYALPPANSHQISSARTFEGASERAPESSPDHSTNGPASGDS